jgi:ketosteroid isomerase-like protein
MRRWPSILLPVLLCLPGVSNGGETGHPDPSATVRATELDFARSMADRDLDAFRTFLDDEAVFFGGPEPLRGPVAIVATWSRYFEGDEAPFSWEPEVVEVLKSGDLALSSGPVLDPRGKRIGTFQSIWRRDEDGNWKIVFDKGCDWCGEE